MKEGKDRVKKEVTRISSGLLLTLAPESESYLKVAHHFSWEEFLARLPSPFSLPVEFHTKEGVIDRSAKTMLLPPTATLPIETPSRKTCDYSQVRFSLLEKPSSWLHRGCFQRYYSNTKIAFCRLV